MNDAWDYDNWKLESGIHETVLCPECDGEGEFEEEEGWIECPTCQGSGEIDKREATSLLATLRVEES